MANRIFNPPRALEKELVTITGSFLPAGTGAVTGVTGKGFTVARSDVGKFTVTLTDTYQSLIGVSLTLGLATAADQVLQLGAVDVTSAKTIVINVWDISDAAVADISANAANRIYFTFFLKNSSL